MTQKSFEISLRKGTLGEKICREKLEAKGWVVYSPVTEGAHAFDMLAIKDKMRAIAMDVKAKARLNYMPATGINQNHFEIYDAFSRKHNMPFWIIFVDEWERKIYGNSIERLECPFKSPGHGMFPVVKNWKVPIRLWHLNQMIHIADVDEDLVADLEEVSQRAYGYGKERGEAVSKI